MPYHREDEVSRLIQSWWHWSGDGQSARGCGSLWGRIVRETFRSSTPVVVVGVDARRAGAALGVIPDGLAAALVKFHTSSLTFEMQARVLSISKATYHRRLLDAHPRFMDAVDMQALRDRAREREVEAVAALASPAPAHERFYRGRRKRKGGGNRP